ncbi:helix-turn-helix domain-containing protein [Colwellia sp. Bg11-28]|uniref:helix-turn-helix domain-containing protein n=1 Tax=Colwellia sp. Bg11-28 TaxID=2058305 RepID=UPI000C341475|nr:AraC family transcriptional regulator [Colwellia sp. Bg11-28]
MQNLIKTIKHVMVEDRSLPFSVYSSVKEQHLLNVPIVKPLFIAVLDGDKVLGKAGEIVCHAGDFIFLSDNPAINMRNIPKKNEYFALLIEFDNEDFVGISIENSADGEKNHRMGEGFSVGDVSQELEKCLQQFVEWSLYSPKAMWPLRKKEILQLLCHMGHPEILTMVASHKLGQKISAMLSEQPSADVSMPTLCQHLGMSESTLRRKLSAEGTTVQTIKDQVKLGLGLHLLQTTKHSIVFIAAQCGYQSQSRFTSRFKGRFGLTPSELRKTKLTDQGENLTELRL